MFKGVRLFLIMLTFIAVVAGFIAGASTVTFIEAKPNGYEKLSLFTKVLHIIESNYVEEVDIKKLIYGGIKGMLSELDPHSTFLPPDQYKEMKESTTGKFGGLGIEITLKDNVLTIITPIEGTPAWKQGLKPMDKIIKINNESTSDMDVQAAVNKMRGKPGTKVKIMVVRDGEKDPLEFEITREIINVISVKSTLLEKNYGYIKISTFNERVAADARKGIAKLKSQSKNDLKGLILDLRNNPGGLLDQAVEVSDIFIDKGLIVSIQGRDKDKKAEEYAKPNGTIKDIPLLVLINESSASASEIVAGALQDHKRAILVGQKTFGKGSVQVLVEMDDKSAIKYTTARYYTPSGRSIQAMGIKPDVEILPVDPKIMEDEIKMEEFRKQQYSEASLKGHFENENDEEVDDVVNKEGAGLKQDLTNIYKRVNDALNKRYKDRDLNKVIDLDVDYQARQALNYLKVYTMGIKK
ncbi:MAG: S41 family peptidase [Oligoflexia bacterium]|nr:S41 family peptidase [Oligoflexia bacterium]